MVSFFLSVLPTVLRDESLPQSLLKNCIFVSLFMRREYACMSKLCDHFRKFQEKLCKSCLNIFAEQTWLTSNTASSSFSEVAASVASNWGELFLSVVHLPCSNDLQVMSV